MDSVFESIFQNDVSVIVATVVLIALTSYFLLRNLRVKNTPVVRKIQTTAPNVSERARKLVEALASALPDDVIIPEHAARFAQAREGHWDQQEVERVPSCIVRPRNVTDLSTAVKILKHAYDEHQYITNEDAIGSGSRNAGLFAIRSGGHSPISGAASIDGGVVIDLSLFNSITLSDDTKTIEVGPGCRWGAISKFLDDRGLAVVGGRNSQVGVGGLLLAGGISFFSPQYGFAANNVDSYQVVLADGSVVVASQHSRTDLWRALKGGSNNFGIVTRFTLRTVPCGKIWGGWIYLPSFQSRQVLEGIHELQSRKRDAHIAGPITSFTYIQNIGVQLICINLIYTKAITEWPACFSMFKPLWRFWSTCRLHSVTEAYEEMATLSPYGLRQAYATTTIKNDPATIAEAHASYAETIQRVKKVKGLAWTIVFQPLHPTWLRKGDPNPMGLQDCPDEPLLLISYTVSWYKAEDDEFVQGEVRECIERIERFAESNGTGYPYRFHNYCGEWQDPFAGYGGAGKAFLQEVSRRYDPDGLFQKGCVGGFKLGMEDRVSASTATP